MPRREARGRWCWGRAPRWSSGSSPSWWSTDTSGSSRWGKWHLRRDNTMPSVVHILCYTVRGELFLHPKNLFLGRYPYDGQFSPFLRLKWLKFLCHKWLISIYFLETQFYRVVKKWLFLRIPFTNYYFMYSRSLMITELARLLSTWPAAWTSVVSSPPDSMSLSETLRSGPTTFFRQDSSDMWCWPPLEASWTTRRPGGSILEERSLDSFSELPFVPVFLQK